jgi:hypothetical protein
MAKKRKFYSVWRGNIKEGDYLVDLVIGERIHTIWILKKLNGRM